MDNGAKKNNSQLISMYHALLTHRDIYFVAFDESDVDFIDAAVFAFFLEFDFGLFGGLVEWGFRIRKRASLRI